MVAYIYRMQVKSGMEEEFIQAWKEITLAYRSAGGAYGSRLHKAGNGDYIAYARWPSQSARDQLSEEVSRSVQAASQSMDAACHTSEQLYQLDLVSDLLQEPEE